MSFTATILPILSVVAIAQDQLQLERWLPVNKQQSVFLDTVYSKRDELAKLTTEELSSCVSQDIQEVNQFLRKRGFTIQLEDTGRDGLAVASILDIALTWKVPGTQTVVTSETAQEFPAVSMKLGYALYGTGKTEETLIALECENKDTVYVTLADKPREGFELLAHIEALSRLCRRTVTNEFSDILFPMVSIDHEVDISWLCGLRSQENWFINQALQQTRFQMDEKGAGVQSAVVISAVRCILKPKPTLEINKPFYLWIMRPGMSIPLFAAYIAYEDWKQPAKRCQK